MGDLTITGLAEVQRLFAESPSILVDKVLYQALDRAAGVIAAEVEARCPETPLASNQNLREAVIVVVDVNHQKKGGTGTVGFKSTISDRTGLPMDAIASLVEFGHEMLTHDKKAPKHGLTHVPPHPFMRPAFDATGDRAIEVFQENLVDGLAAVLPMEKS